MAELSTMSVKGMILHHATTKLGWTREETVAAFDEWFGGCPLHRESIGQNHMIRTEE